jgi:molybdenum cofactor biosynthesis protein B
VPSPADEHRIRAEADARLRAVGCAVLTVSDTRTEATDRSGALARELLAGGGHEVVAHAIVRDEPDLIRARLCEWIDGSRAAVIVVTGGTGIAPRDTTVEVVRSLLTAELEGFGEIFRAISMREVGPAAMLSRAIGGLVARPGAPGAFVFALPGSPGAVETALRELILPELRHLVGLRTPAASPAPSSGGAPAAPLGAVVVGHGYDLVDVARIEAMLAEHGDRFTRRCFTAAERAYADAARRRRGERYAARFAAKEAALKALGTGLRGGIRWTDVAVEHERGGRPRLVVTGRCAAEASARGVVGWLVSLSHAAGLAAASVLALGGHAARGGAAPVDGAGPGPRG